VGTIRASARRYLAGQVWPLVSTRIGRGLRVEGKEMNVVEEEVGAEGEAAPVVTRLKGLCVLDHDGDGGGDDDGVG